jgi:hypothetical protein
LTVGVTPGVSEDEADEGEVSGPEEELIELIVFLTAPEAISFRGIDLAAPESDLATGIDEFADSKEGRDSTSSLNLDSCDDRGVPAFSAANSWLGESVLGTFIGASFRDGTADKPPPDVDLDTLLLSLLAISEVELLLEVPDLFPLGTSPNLNFSPET